MDGVQARFRRLSQQAHEPFHAIGKEGAHRAEGEVEHHAHQHQENREGQVFVHENAVEPLGKVVLLRGAAAVLCAAHSLVDGRIARGGYQRHSVDVGIGFAAALDVFCDGGTDSRALLIGEIGVFADHLVAFEQLHGHPVRGRGVILIALVVIAADVHVRVGGGVVVVAVALVAVLVVLFFVKGAVRIVPAQGGHDFAHGQAGVRIVALHGPGNRGRFRLLVNGGKHLVKPHPALGGNGHHRRAQKFGQRRAIHAAAIFAHLVHQIERHHHGPGKLQ